MKVISQEQKAFTKGCISILQNNAVTSSKFFNSPVELAVRLPDKIVRLICVKRKQLITVAPSKIYGHKDCISYLS